MMNDVIAYSKKIWVKNSDNSLISNKIHLKGFIELEESVQFRVSNRLFLMTHSSFIIHHSSFVI